MSTEEDFNFQIYRPPRQSNRLEPTYRSTRTDEWRPSIDYSQSLHTIQTQMTPAEAYRERLRVSGPHIRMLQRLELRWQRNWKAFQEASLCIQAWYRGWSTRQRIYSKKVAYRKQKQLEDLESNVEQALEQLDFHQVIVNAQNAFQKYEELRFSTRILTALCEAQYALKAYTDCISTSEELGDSPRALFLHACCLVHLGNPSEALVLLFQLRLFLTESMQNETLYAGDDIEVDETQRNILAQLSEDTYRLTGLLHAQSASPDLNEALEAYNELLILDPQHPDRLLDRACMLISVWRLSEACDNLRTAVAVNPSSEALVFSARINMVERDWKSARENLTLLLRGRSRLPEVNELLSLIEDPIIHKPPV